MLCLMSECGLRGDLSSGCHGYRTLWQHLGDLKKENFSLKLRIYFLEERVQSQTPDLDRDLSRTNIELNVQLQSLKKELEEKEQLLQQAISTAELVSNQSAEDQRGRDEATNQIQMSLEARIQQLQQELCERQQSESSLQRLHKQTLDQKDRVISELSTRKVSLEQKVQELSSVLRKRPHCEQDGGVCESTTERCLTELHRAQNQVHTLQTKIRISEDRNKLLQKCLGQMELELRNVREEAQTQERNLQHLQDTLLCKDQEAADLHRVVEEQNRTLCSLKQFSSSPVCGVSELQMLLQQKNAVDRELHELKTQLHKTGFSSLSQIRRALMELRSQNQNLKHQLSQPQDVTSQQQEQGAEMAEESDQWEGWDSQLTFDRTQTHDLDLIPEIAEAQDSPLHRGGTVDLGYETCERSETEAERDTSSPEFDDLEMCLSLDHGSHWWNLQNQEQVQDQEQALEQEQDQDQERNQGQDFTQILKLSLDSTPYRQVQELQRLVHYLKSELNRSKVKIQRLQTSLQSQPEAKTENKTESELDPDLADLLSRVESLENQFKTESKTKSKTETQEGSKTGYLSLVHLQARELSRLRQVLRESRGLVQILVQVQTEQLKGLEALLVSQDPDYDLGVRVREQLRESHELLLRLSNKISLKDLPEDPDDKTELLAMRLSKELQQKELIIESLRSKLRPDTPSTDQSDRISYVSDEQLSNQDEDFCSEAHSELQIDQSQSSNQTGGQSERSSHYDGQSEQSGHYYGQSEQSGVYGIQSEKSGLYNSQSACFYSHTDPRSVFSSVPPSITSTRTFLTMHGSPGHAPTGVSTLRPLHPRPVVALSLPGFSSSSLDSGLRPGLGFRPGLWDMAVSRPEHLSPAASSLHTLSNALPGSELLAEHLSEVRSLRLRLEESIQTNDRLRAHLETRLDPPTATAPTNIYIQGADSTETRVLRETSLSLQTKIRAESLSEAERLREALLLVQARLKETELQAQKWAELSQTSQSKAIAQRQELMALRLEQQRSLEVTHSLQLQVKALQQQLRDQSEQSEAALNRSEQSKGEIDQSQQSEGSVSNVYAETRARQRLQFNDCPTAQGFSPAPGQHLDWDLHLDLDQDSSEVSGDDSGPALKQDSIRLQRTLRDSVDLLKTIDWTLKTRTKEGLNQDCERLRVLLDEAQIICHRTRIRPENRQVESLKSEVSRLRQKLSEKEQTLRETTENVQKNSRSNQALEQLIISQLSQTRDVLRKAKTNLQATHTEVTVF